MATRIQKQRKNTIGHSPIIPITEFGLEPDTNKNASAVIQKALKVIEKNGGGTLFFPKGTYRFYEEGTLKTTDGPYVSNNQDDFPKWTAFAVKKMKNMTIDGDGSLFLFHHRMMVFNISQSANIAIKNLAIDFVTPIHTDSTITAIEKSRFTLQFVSGTTYKINSEGKFAFFIDGDEKKDWGAYSFEGATGRSKYLLAGKGAFPLLHKLKAIESEPGVVSFNGDLDLGFKIGDRITHRHNDRNHVGIFIDESKNTTLNDVTIHHACGMGVLGQRSTDITINKFLMTPREGTGRISTAMADATHFSGCRGLIKVTDSHFQGMMDDAINVHGTSLRITQINRDKNSIIVSFMHDQSKGYTIASPGDEIRFINNRTMLSVGEGFYEVKTAKAIDVNRVKIVFTDPLPSELKKRFAIENITYTPEVIFSGNTVQNNRARGVLFNTPRRCLVENNFIKTSGSAILVAGDANGWFESGAVGEFGPTIIRNNIFEDCLTNMFQFCNAIISIDPVINETKRNQSYHRDIHIKNNIFRVFDAPLIFARSIDGLYITGNTFEKTETFTPWHPNKKAFLFEACQNVIIKDNKN